MNLPNKLTLLRIFMIPFFIACFYIDLSWNYLVAAIIFILAYATDAIDGSYARRHNQVTDFGKFMDPIADKLLTSAAIIFMLAKGILPPVFGEIFVFVTIAREFIVSGLRLVAASNNNVIAAGKLGKIKTVLQSITIPVILLDGYLFVSSSTVKLAIDITLLSVTLILTVWSGIDYLVRNRSVWTQAK